MTQTMPELFLACAMGDLEKVKSLLNEDTINTISLVHEKYSGSAFTRACTSGNLKLLEYLLDSSFLKDKIHIDISAIMHAVSSPDCLVILDFLLNHENATPHLIYEMSPVSHNNLLMKACLDGQLETVQYLLTSNKLKEHAQINQLNAFNQSALLLAVAHVEIVKYLLDSTDLKEHANLYQKDNEGSGILSYCCEFGFYDTIQYCIIDKQMVIDEETKKWLEDNRHHDVIHMIQARDNFNLLHKQLDNKTTRSILKI